MYINDYRDRARWRKSLASYVLSVSPLFLSADLFWPTLSISASDKLLEATLETLATPRCFRGVRMIQRQLRPRSRRRKRSRRRRRRRRWFPIYIVTTPEKFVSQNRDVEFPSLLSLHVRLSGIKRTRHLNGIFDKVFHLVVCRVRAPGIALIRFLLSPSAISRK